MKIGIHKREGSFSQRWIDYCEDNQVSYKTIDCYSSDIVKDTKDCDIILWHFHHNDYRDMLFAKQLLFSLEQAGKIVFPDAKTVWHFDDKVGQKFLLESLELPFIPTYLFYDQDTAEKWIETTSFPKVFKLRGGAGSANVRIVKSKSEAKHIIKKAFSKGFSAFDGKQYVRNRLNKYKSGVITLRQLVKSSLRLLISRKGMKLIPPELGYVYFQNFFPNQDGDIRIVVIGNKAFGIKRLVLENDFRASGSGKILYNKKYFSLETISLAFNIAKKLKTQACAIDFIYENSLPRIVEISYGFTQKGYDGCEGYWDEDLNWFEGPFNPQEWIIKNTIEQHGHKNME